MSTILERIITVGLLVVMASTALAHGALEPWARLLFELLVVALVVLWGIKTLVDKKLKLYIPKTVWPLVALLLLAFIQSISWTGNDGSRQSLSFDVEATVRGGLVLLCLIAVLLIAGNFWVSSQQLQRFAKWMTIYGLALALFGIAQHFTWNGNIYWLRATTSDAVFGPFTNRNHFAGYMELLLPWPLVMVFLRWGEKQEQLFYGLAATWMGAAAVLTLSRGGMISIFAELLALAVMSHFLPSDSELRGAAVPRRKFIGMQIGVVTVVLAAIIVGALWLRGEQLVNRLSTGNELGGATQAQTFASSRGDLWLQGWAIFRAHPWMGVGLGGYEVAYHTYGGDNGLQLLLSHAHNDYLQALTDGGIIGGGIVLWILFLIGRIIKRGLQVRSPVLCASAIACSGGMMGLLVHSLFDFNLQLPSHALLFVCYAAILERVGVSVTNPVRQSVVPSLQAVEAPSVFQRSLR